MVKFFTVLFICSLTSQIATSHQSIVDQRMETTRLPCRSFFEFNFCGEDRHLWALERWLTPIVKTKIGKEMLEEIAKSRHKFLFMHSQRAVTTAGSTVSVLTTKLSNGVGTDAVISMNFDMPDSGSHLVTIVGSRELMNFKADENLFHELSHARHTLNGTMATMREVQAILDTNVYREEIAQINGQTDVKLRNYRNSERDQQIWFGDEADLLLVSGK